MIFEQRIGEVMDRKMTFETSDETIDLGRRNIMARFGLMASVACAAPVLMTMSTSAQAGGRGGEKSAGHGNSSGHAGGTGKGAENSNGTAGGGNGGSSNGNSGSNNSNGNGNSGSTPAGEDDPIEIVLY